MLTTLATAGIAAHVGGPFHAGFGFLFLLIPLFWIALIALVFGIFGRRMRRAAWARSQNGQGGPWGAGGPWSNGGRFGQPSLGAESTLAERFAQGDIDEVEYRARLEVLRANAYPAQNQ